MAPEWTRKWSLRAFLWSFFCVQSLVGGQSVTYAVAVVAIVAIVVIAASINNETHYGNA